MKKMLMLAFTFLLVLTIHVGEASAVIVKDEEKVSFTMTENEKWFMKSDNLNQTIGHLTLGTDSPFSILKDVQLTQESCE